MFLTEEQRRQMIRDAGDPGKCSHWRVYSDGTIELKKTSYEVGDLVVHKFRDRFCVVDRQTSYEIADFSKLKYVKIFCEELNPICRDLLRKILDGDTAAQMRFREMLVAHGSGD